MTKRKYSPCNVIPPVIFEFVKKKNCILGFCWRDNSFALKEIVTGKTYLKSSELWLHFQKNID